MGRNSTHPISPLRVMAMGYTNVVWYPEGSDGWGDALLPLEDSKPVSAE